MKNAAESVIAMLSSVFYVWFSAHWTFKVRKLSYICLSGEGDREDGQVSGYSWWPCSSGMIFVAVPSLLIRYKSSVNKLNCLQSHLLTWALSLDEVQTVGVETARSTRPGEA